MVVTTGVSSRRGSQVVGSPSTEGRLYIVAYLEKVLSNMLEIKKDPLIYNLFEIKIIQIRPLVTDIYFQKLVTKGRM